MKVENRFGPPIYKILKEEYASDGYTLHLVAYNSTEEAFLYASHYGLDKSSAVKICSIDRGKVTRYRTHSWASKETVNRNKSRVERLINYAVNIQITTLLISELCLSWN